MTKPPIRWFNAVCLTWQDDFDSALAKLGVHVRDRGRGLSYSPGDYPPTPERRTVSVGVREKDWDAASTNTKAKALLDRVGAECESIEPEIRQTEEEA